MGMVAYLGADHHMFNKIDTTCNMSIWVWWRTWVLLPEFLSNFRGKKIKVQIRKKVPNKSKNTEIFDCTTVKIVLDSK